MLFNLLTAVYILYISMSNFPNRGTVSQNKSKNLEDPE